MIDIPDFSPLRVAQSSEKLGRKQVDSLDHVLVVLPKRPRATLFRGLPKARHLEALVARANKADDTFVTTFVDNKRPSAITIATLEPPSNFELLCFARKLVAESKRIKAAKLGVVVNGFASDVRNRIIGSVVRATEAAAFVLPSFKSKKPPRYSGPRSIKLLAAEPRLSLAQVRASCAGNNLARWLTALPPNKLTAPSYRAVAQSIAKSHSMNYEFIGIDQLKRLGAGAFLAVAQGNANADAGIIRLSYRPKKADRPVLALVGKGILFDTGGINLKPFKSMLEMHTDMQGSAVALGTAVELVARQVPYAFDVWLAITENQISSTAYKSQDVVVAANGTSIQVSHTDAEGRMVLADALALAASKKPDLIIDYATLTGTCVSALTTRYSGVFSNRSGAVRDLLSAGAQSGERVWPFPLDADFDEPLSSDTADVKQCVIEGAGDHIFAAKFLQRFIPSEIAWIHIDLSAGQHKGGLGAIPTQVTGFGVAYTLALLAGDDPASLAAGWPAE
jgi:leucyl aminopeptidase